MKEIQVQVIDMKKKSYYGNYMPHIKSNEAELNLFLSTEETSPTG